MTLGQSLKIIMHIFVMAELLPDCLYLSFFAAVHPTLANSNNI